MNLVVGVSSVILGVGLFLACLFAGAVASIIADAIAGFVIDTLFSRKDAAFRVPVQCALGVVLTLIAAGFAAFDSRAPPQLSSSTVVVSDLPLYAMITLSVVAAAVLLVDKCVHRLRDAFKESVRRGEPV